MFKHPDRKTMADTLYKPKYLLRLSANDISYDIKLNDCPVFEFKHEVRLNADFPVNQWLISGNNLLSVNIKANKQREFLSVGDTCNIEIVKRTEGKNGIEETSVAALNKTIKDYDSKQNLRNMSLTQTFNADINIGPWLWTKDSQANDLPETLKALTAELQELHSIIKEKEINKLSKKLELRDIDMAAANYTDLETEQGLTISEFESFFDSPNLVLQEIDLKVLTIKLFGNRKLVRIDTLAGNSPIVLSDIEGHYDVFLPFIFCRDEQKKWVIIR